MILAKWAAWLENKFFGHECGNCDKFYEDVPGCEIGKCEFTKWTARRWQYCCAWRPIK